MTLSAIIITFNEERDLPGCLESLTGVVDEIVVVDNHSTDATRDIARRYTDKIFLKSFEGYGPQKQFALEQASGDWVLNIDADERLTPALAEEIKGLRKNADSCLGGYEIPFQVYFLGHRLRFGGCFSEWHIRLFQRHKACYGGKTIHEGIEVSGPLGRLKSAMRHESYQNFSEYLEKCSRYTGLIAHEKFSKGKRFHLWHHLRLPWEFLMRYVVKLGFLDGNAGLIYAMLSAYYAWLKHVRLIEGEKRFLESETKNAKPH